MFRTFNWLKEQQRIYSISIQYCWMWDVKSNVTTITVEFLPPLRDHLLTFYSAVQSKVWTHCYLHHQSNHMKAWALPVNNPVAICFFFTHIQNLIPLSWNFDFLFDPWTSAVIEAFTWPLLESALMNVTFLTEVWRHYRNVLPLNSYTFSTGQFHLRVDWHVPVTFS